MKSVVREAVETIVLALLIFLALQFTVQNYRVEGSSMEPTLEEGQHVLVNKVVYFHVDPQAISRVIPFVKMNRQDELFPFHPPRRGDVVVFDFRRCHPKRSCVKRVIGLPGDIIEMRRGRVYINGSPLEEPYIKNLGNYSMEPMRVPQGTFFVLGDNRRASNDSRNWGPVPLDSIVGRAWLSYWPLNRWHVLLDSLWVYR